MAPEEQKLYIKKQASRRDQIKQQINAISEQRQRYIETQVAPAAINESLDEKIYSAVKDQAKDKGLIYDSDRAEY